MRLIIIVMLFSLIYIVSSKNNNVKTLTESMGQEVIEIGNPIKELPMGLEEEPSAENDDDDKIRITSNTVLPVTKKEFKKTTTLSDVKKNMKDIEKIDGMTRDDEETRIEKELAEIYKDTADYKGDSSEEKDKENEKDVVKETTTNKEQLDYPSLSDDPTSAEEAEKPIGRQRNNFKFQPDTTDKAGIERFRTSIDEIKCNNNEKLSWTKEPESTLPQKNKAFDTVSNGVLWISAVLCYVFICT